MKKFKYLTSSNGDQDEICVCDACKKANMENILIGKWRLIDRWDDSGTFCDLCQINAVANE